MMHPLPLLLVAIVSALAPASAQQPQVPGLGPTGAPWLQDPRERSPLEPQRAPFQPRYREGFQGLQAVYPQYPGFPVYPPGYGPGQRLLGYLRRDRPEGELWQPDPLPTGAPARWPSWLDRGIAEADRAPAADRALLVRTSERVWFLPPGETVFAPLWFWDKVRAVRADTALEVREQGEFEIVFHDGALLRARGPTRLQIKILSPELAELHLDDLRRIWLTAKQRPFRLRLPDQSVLEVEKSETYLESADGRGAIYNHGNNPLRWNARGGTVELPPAQRADFLVASRETPPIAAGLRLEGPVRAQRKGRILEVFGEGPGGRVQWSGASIPVPPGGTVRLDPLAGNEFPEKER